jgi:hypothetical protein
MMKEHPIYNNILVSEDGSIYSTGKNYKLPRKLKECLDENGYTRVGIQVGSYNQKKRAVHRLVAETYLPNPNNYSDVHHKDHNPRNNHLSNLEWCPHKKNCEYSRDKIGQNKSQKWLIENIKTGETFYIFNMSKWCEENNLDRANLHKTFTKSDKIKQHKGFRIIKKGE